MLESVVKLLSQLGRSSRGLDALDNLVSTSGAVAVTFKQVVSHTIIPPWEMGEPGLTGEALIDRGLFSAKSFPLVIDVPDGIYCIGLVSNSESPRWHISMREGRDALNLELIHYGFRDLDPAVTTPIFKMFFRSLIGTRKILEANETRRTIQICLKGSVLLESLLDHYKSLSDERKGEILKLIDDALLGMYLPVIDRKICIRFITLEEDNTDFGNMGEPSLGVMKRVALKKIEIYFDTEPIDDVQEDAQGVAASTLSNNQKTVSDGRRKATEPEESTAHPSERDDFLKKLGLDTSRKIYLSGNPAEEDID